MPHGLEEEDGGGDADVEGVEAAEHGDADVGIGCTAPLGGEACRFGAHDEGGGRAHVGVVVEVGILQLGGQYADSFRFEETDAVVRRAADGGDGEDGADGSADEVGVVEVGEGVADDDGVGPCCIGRAEHGTEVSGLFDAFEHHDEGVVAEVQVVEREVAGTNGGHDAFGRVAVGDFFIDGG